MWVIGNFFGAVAWLLHAVLFAVMWMVIINAVLSWIRPDPNNGIVMLLDRVSDLVCNPIRRLFPTVYSGFDFAPLIVILVLGFLDRWVVPSLQGMAARMG